MWKRMLSSTPRGCGRGPLSWCGHRRSRMRRSPRLVVPAATALVDVGSCCNPHCHPRHRPAGTDRVRAARARRVPAGYRGLTREACTLDLRQFTAWCRLHSLSVFAVRRAGIETFVRDLEANGTARATVTRRLCTIAGSCKYAAGDELLGHSPAAHVRRPRLDYEPDATALDRNELGAILVAGGLGPPPGHALVSLPALNGLRVCEATGARRRAPRDVTRALSRRRRCGGCPSGGVMRCSGRCTARSATGRLAERRGYGVCGQVCTGWLVCMLST